MAITKDTTINDVMAQAPGAMGVLMLYGIDPGSDGEKSIEAAAVANGANMEEFLKAITDVA